MSCKTQSCQSQHFFLRQMKNNDNQPRVIFIGDSGVGKTSIIHYAKNGFFEARTMSTVGAGITQMNHEVNGHEVKFQLWDTAGQEIYRTIVPIYFKGATVAVIVFSLTDDETFNHLDGWIKQLREHTSNDVGVIIVGNKLDNANLSVDTTIAKKWAEEKGFQIIFTSASTGENVDVLIDYIASQYIYPATIPLPEDTQLQEKKDKKSCC